MLTLIILSKLGDSSRSCQLSLPASGAIGTSSSSKPGSGQVQDLMQWQHLDPRHEGILEDDPVLQLCANYLSFIFKKETIN
jgi:hypothetical protein